MSEEVDLTLPAHLDRRNGKSLAVIDGDAVAIGDLYERSNGSFADAVLARLECGKRLTEKKASMKHGEWLPWIEGNADTLGFGESAALKLMKAAKTNPELTTDLDDDEAIKLSRQMWGNSTTRGTFGTGENDWHTPDKYLDAARSVLGEFDLDPASSDAAQDRVKATAYLTPDDDGLSVDWVGRIWLNPPYAQPLIAQFVSKLVAERRSGNVTDAILLTHNYTDTAWFNEAAHACDAICFTRGRVQFINANGEIAAPTQGQAFFYFGARIPQFWQAFHEIGHVWLPYRGG